jgi:hypothetical protein
VERDLIAAVDLDLRRVEAVAADHDHDLRDAARTGQKQRKQKSQDAHRVLPPLGAGPV